jgi:adenosylcobinamide-GDP ribazoletransferase
MTDPAPSAESAVPSALAQLRLAASFLTRMPMAHVPAAPLAAAVRAFPVVGALVGAIGAGVYAGASFAGLPPLPAALLAVLATILASGALHEDGLADFADASGARTIEKRLAIMRDSRIGAFGTLALIFSVALRCTAVAAIGKADLVAIALVASGAASRAAMVYAMHALPFARADGLAKMAGQPSAGNLRIALLLGVLFLVPLGYLAMGLALAFAAAAAMYMGTAARRLLGGQTGDVLGCVQQTSEVAILLAILIAMNFNEG